MSISNTLERIASKSDWIRMDAIGLAEYVRRLPARRSFETNAEDAMARAEIELITALETVRAARRQFNALPADDKAA